MSFRSDNKIDGWCVTFDDATYLKDNVLNYDNMSVLGLVIYHDDVIKWKYFQRHCPFVRGIHQSPVDSPHKGQWRGALVFSLICAWTNSGANNRDADYLRRHCVHYDLTVMWNGNLYLKQHDAIVRLQFNGNTIDSGYIVFDFNKISNKIQQ